MSSHRIWRWRMLTVVSGLLLAACFVMPTFQSAGSPVSLAREIRSEFGLSTSLDPWYRFRWGLTIFSMMCASYLFGLLMATRAAARLIPRRNPARIATGALAVLTIGDCLSLLCVSTVFLARWDSWAFLRPILANPLAWLMVLGFIIVPAAALPYLVWSFRLGARSVHCHAFCGSLACLAWFVTWWGIAIAFDDSVHYGFMVSITASCLLLAATVGEARTVTGHPWWRTIGQLLTCRLRDASGRERLCPKCGYDLFGLREMRCPECGRPFTFAELGTTADALGFESGSKDGDR